MNRKKMTAFLTCVALLTAQGSSFVWADNETENEVAQDHPDGTGESVGVTGGYLESNLDDNTPVYDSGIETYADIPAAYPASGDSAIDEIKNTYPDTRNQNPYGTCWAFASIGLAEFDLINDGTAKKDIDLSELQLVNFTFDSVTDPLGGTQGDYSKFYKDNASNSILYYGGNFEYASRRLSQWYGAVKESDVPYTDADSVADNGLDSKYAYDYDEAHLQSAYMISRTKNTADVKQAIMEHGAVGAMYTNYNAGMNYIKNNYYDYKGIPAAIGDGGHAVMIVGWDDNYSKDDFATDVKPENDGAWLIRNSWGTYFSYFWMSYETYSMAETTWVFDFSADDGYDNNYQYDGGLETAVYPYYKTVANVFTVPEKDDVTSETLKAVSLSFMETADVGYTIEVYTDLTDLKNPKSGVKQEAATTTGSTAFAGIYTIPLENEVRLTPGSSYAVVVTTDKAAIDQEYAISYADMTTTPETPVWDHVVSGDNGRSLYYNGSNFGTWTNNYCIKAFTADNTKDDSIDDGKDDTKDDSTDSGKDDSKDDTTDDIKTDAEKVSAAKSVVETVLKTIKATNDTKQSDIQSEVNDALDKAGITGVTATVGNFTKENATSKTEGSIGAEVTISSENASDTVKYSGTIEKLSDTDNRDDSKTDTKDDSKTDTKDDSNTDTKDDGKTDTKDDSKADTKDDSKTDTKDDSKTDTKDESKNDTKNDSTTEIKNGLYHEGSVWNYYVNGKIATDVTTLVKYNGSWWYVQNGRINFSTTTLCKYNGTWWYVQNGRVNFGATTLCKYNGTWWYVQNGQVNFNIATLCKYNGTWWYVQGGKVNFNASGLCKYNGSWWYVQNGRVNFYASGLCKYNGIWWYVQNGKINFNATGLCKYNGSWWYIQNGRINFNLTTLCKYNGSWWYIQNGRINFSVTTLCKYGNNWFAVSGGKVAWGYTGYIKYNGMTFKVVNGIVRF